tara:strand:+ start:10786 stop:11037 length:252 start_codon:yes stop_codon:yes gene_type:complete
VVNSEQSIVEDYEFAWVAWQKQLSRIHDVFLKGEKISPDRLKGLLNRESRAKNTYDEARNRLLGISPDTDLFRGKEGGNPFKE